MENISKSEIAILGAGCFWGIESAFRQLKGVKDVEVGYSGGNLENPTYEDVCGDKTGHAEVAKVMFNPNKISYEEILDHFWKIHDPTRINMQGPDVGSQYRSVIFYASENQRESAEKSKAKLEQSGKFNSPVATQIQKADKFYPADEYHQRYLEKTGRKKPRDLKRKIYLDG